MVAGNRIGTDVTGTVSITNVAGVSIRISDYTRIGTNGDGVSDEFERNIISGNDGEAIAYPCACIAISFYRVSDSVIAGNYIGTDVTGLVALPNDLGINTSDFNQRNRIGTDANGIADAAERNVISGNTGWQVNIHSGWQDSIIAGNYIGVGADGTTPLGGNKGISLSDAGTVNPTQNNLIGGTTPAAANVIAYNINGIKLQFDYVRNTTIRGNRIFNNGLLGIDLTTASGVDGVTPNDPGDADIGPNDLQNYPVLTGATPVSVAGTLNSTPDRTFTLEFFSNSECDPSGYGEGETFQPTTAPATVTTDGSGAQLSPSPLPARFRRDSSSRRRPPI